MLNSKRLAPLNAREKMPFELTAVYYRLQRYNPAGSEASAAASLSSPDPLGTAAGQSDQPDGNDQSSPPAESSPVANPHR